ncbi:MAG: CRISPR-associated endonuclease Cas1, partial [Fimbriimonadaceae bacterium]
MTERIVEVANPAFLMVENRQLAVKRDGEEKATVPIEDIGVLILDGYSITLTFNLIQEVLAGGAAIVFCDEKHNPSGLALNLEAHSLHTAVLRQQVECSMPKKKRVWQQIVQAKIDAQANLLRWKGKPMRPARTRTQLVYLIGACPQSPTLPSKAHLSPGVYLIGACPQSPTAISLYGSS